MNGRTATKDDFLNPDVFNLLDSQIDTVLDIVNAHDLQHKQIWLGIT